MKPIVVHFGSRHRGASRIPQVKEVLQFLLRFSSMSQRKKARADVEQIKVDVLIVGTGEKANHQYGEKDFNGLRSMEHELKRIDPKLHKYVLQEQCWEYSDNDEDEEYPILHKCFIPNPIWKEKLFTRSKIETHDIDKANNRFKLFEKIRDLVGHGNIAISYTTVDQYILPPSKDIVSSAEKANAKVAKSLGISSISFAQHFNRKFQDHIERREGMYDFIWFFGCTNPH